MSNKRRERLIDEVTTAIVEETGITTTRFLTSAKQPAFEHAKWHYFAYAYDRAFGILWDTAFAETKLCGRSPLLSPLLFLCRQSIELWLKAALDAFDPSEPPPEGHDFEHLWQKLLAALDDAGQPTEDSFTASVRLALETIGVHDARGDRFRYPTARDASPYPETAADLERLFKAHYRITTYCEAVHTMVEEFVGYLAESAP